MYKQGVVPHHIIIHDLDIFYDIFLSRTKYITYAHSKKPQHAARMRSHPNPSIHIPIPSRNTKIKPHPHTIDTLLPLLSSAFHDVPHASSSADRTSNVRCTWIPPSLSDPLVARSPSPLTSSLESPKGLRALRAAFVYVGSGRSGIPPWSAPPALRDSARCPLRLYPAAALPLPAVG